MDYVLRTESLVKQYGRFNALCGLTMNVPKGSIYGFIGRNGAGKSTLIKSVCGLQEPTSGSYEIFGIGNRDRRIFDSRSRLGAVAESPAIYMNMSASDNLRQQCTMLGLPDYGCVSDILELVGLQNTGTKKAGRFSLGMKQRLGIAVSLVGNPDFLILDEPINGLDPQGIVEIRELVLRLNRERGMTVLVSSHILDELAKIATHFGFIDGGRIIKEADAKELNAAFRRCMHVRVNNIKAASAAFDSMGLRYEAVSETEADIFTEISVTRLVYALAENNCELISVTERNENLETYFMNLVGGDH